jgi:hypothetical protein
MAVTNTLAYYDMATITAIKKFYCTGLRERLGGEKHSSLFFSSHSDDEKKAVTLTLGASTKICLTLSRIDICLQPGLLQQSIIWDYVKASPFKTSLYSFFFHSKGLRHINSLLAMYLSEVYIGRHDTQHNDIEHNDTQHYILNSVLSIASLRIMTLSIMTLSIITLSIIGLFATLSISDT